MKTNSESGFTIVELTIAALLTVGLLGAIFSILNRNQQVFVTEMGVVDMNQNIRTAMDLLTRDIQSAATGLPVAFNSGAGCLAGIFYVDGAGTNPDAIMIINGDPVAPTAEVKQQVSSGSQLLLFPPPDVKSTDGGKTFSYADLQNNNVAKSIYVTTDNDLLKRRYLVYDEDHCQVFKLAASGALTTDSTGNQFIQLQYGSVQNPAGVFANLMGTAVDGNAAPDCSPRTAAVAVLGGTVAYKLDANTHELMRTEDLQNWYTVARGVLDFQIQYRVMSKDSGAIEEKVVNKPGVDKFDSGAPTSRRGIRSVILTIRAETPDLDPGDKGYRQTVQKFEITPRNLNFSNNNNLSS
ncbi:MAG TPA: hypothetical protein VNI02_06755 [Blastocatellia bacterium]|jgi:type II secretory pathway pseudopilin PulG|nr:hypothetical protein [Blastocatellia bacterium]